MTLLGWEGFDNENLADDLNSMPGWRNIGGTIQTRNSSLGGRAFQFTTAQPIFTPLTGASYTDAIIAIRLIPTSSAVSQVSIFSFYASTGVQCGFGITQSSGPVVYSWTGRSSIFTAIGNIVLPANVETLVEARVTIGSSTTGGYIETHIENVRDISVTANTLTISSQPFFTSISLASAPSAANCFNDDFYLLAVDSVWPNNFLGQIHVDTVRPNANSSVMWIVASSLSSEANWQMVSDAQNDHDSTYNQSSSPTQTDVFTHVAINSSYGSPWDAAAIYGVGSVASVRKNDLTVRSAMTRFVSSGVIKDGTATDIAIGSATVYDYLRDDYVLDPTTSAQWNTASVNQSLIGYKLSS